MSGSRQKKKKRRGPRVRPSPPPQPTTPLSLDDEFAELEREVAAIKQLGPGQTGEQAVLLRTLRAEWAKKGEGRPDLPEWESRLADHMQKLFEGVIAGGTQVVDKQGKLSLRVDAGSAKEELTPIVNALFEGLPELQAIKQVMQELQQAFAPGAVTVEDVPADAPRGDDDDEKP